MRIARNGTRYRGELENYSAVIAVSKSARFLFRDWPEAAAAVVDAFA